MTLTLRLFNDPLFLILVGIHAIWCIGLLFRLKFERRRLIEDVERGYFPGMADYLREKWGKWC